ncbi:beta strand repeat-containing protein, partial [Maribacter ulvicola]
MTNEFLKEELNIKSMKSQITTPLGKSIKGLMVLLTLLLSGISIAQTTVTLEDQCNCEVLQGTDISAPGAVLPTGADLGDLYVNTNTGTIYYWNGTTWELTSTDANTTNASLTEDGINLILSDSDLNTVSIPLVDIAAVVDTNTTNVTFTVNSTNGTLDIIDSENNIVAVPLGDIAALVNTDNQEGTEVLLTNPLDVDGDSVDETTVEEAIADITAANALDLDIDPTNELTTSGAGAPSSAPANDNPGVTYLDTATNELYVYDGTSWTMVTDNQIAGEVDVTPAGNLTSTDVQSALEELDANSSDNQNLTGASLNGSNELQIDIQRGTPATVDLSSLSETIAAGTGAITVTDDGNGNYTVNSTDTDEDETNELAILAAGVPTTNGTNSGDTYVNTDTGQLYAWNGTTWQKVGGSAAPDADPDPENELSDVSLTGTTLELTNPASGATGVDLNNMFATDQELSDAITASEALDLDKDDQNELQDLEDVLTRNPSAGGIVITDVGTPVNANDAVNKAYVDNLADDDVRVTNTASGNRIATISEPGIAAVDINESVTTLSDADADGVFDYVSENNTTTSFDGTDDQNASQVDLATPIDVDGDTVNETTVEEAIADLAANSSDNQDLELNSSTNILSLTNDASTVDLNSYVNNDTNEIQDLQLTGDNLTLTNDPTATAIDLSDYRETVAGAGDITVTNDSDGNYTVNYVDGDNDSTNELTQRGMGGPTGAPVEGTTYVDTDSGQLYVFDSGTWQPVGGSAVPGDASDTNELITSFGVVGPNLRITEAGDDFDVPLSSLGTDDQDLGLGTNGVANQSVEVTITDGAAALIDIRDADNDPNNENQTVSAGTGISVSQSGDDFAVTNTAPDQTVALTDGGNGNVT